MDSILNTTQNLSLISIPGYYLLALAPHAYAIGVVSGGRFSKWDNSNPRAPGLHANIKSRLSAGAYARYERAEAAHYNGLESFPLYVAAVLVANFVKLPVAELNQFALGMAALRAVYNVVYIGTSSKGPITFVRSIVWFAMVGWCLRVLRTAGTMAM